MFKIYKDLDETGTLDDRYKNDYCVVRDTDGRSMFIETYLDMEEELHNFISGGSTQETLEESIAIEFQEYMGSADTFEEAFNLIKMYQTME